MPALINVCRILDVMLTDKCHCALLKVAVAIMKRCERALRQMSDLEDIVKFLKVEVPSELLGTRWERDTCERRGKGG